MNLYSRLTSSHPSVAVENYGNISNFTADTQTIKMQKYQFMKSFTFSFIVGGWDLRTLLRQVATVREILNHSFSSFSFSMPGNTVNEEDCAIHHYYGTHCAPVFFQLQHFPNDILQAYAAFQGIVQAPPL